MTNDMDDKYIELFACFYGDDKRGLIEEKFNQFSKCHNRLNYKKSESFKDRLMLENQTLLSKEDLFGHYDFDGYNNQLLDYACLRALDEKMMNFKNSINNNYYELQKQYLPDITPKEFLVIMETKEIPSKYSKIPSFLKSALLNCSSSYLKDDCKRAFDNCLPLLSKLIPNVNIISFDTDSEEIRKLDDLLAAYFELLDDYNSEYYKVYELNSLYGLKDEEYQVFIDSVNKIITKEMLGGRVGDKDSAESKEEAIVSDFYEEHQDKILEAQTYNDFQIIWMKLARIILMNLMMFY